MEISQKTNDEIIFIKESRCSAIEFSGKLRMRLKNKTGCGSGTSGRVAEVLFLDESARNFGLAIAYMH